MDLNYKILWCEDNDEWFDQISAKVKSYLSSKNMKATLTRMKRGDFKIEDFDFSQHEIMIIDYQLEDDTLGDTIIEGIRRDKYYNDVIFYSSNGRKIVDDVLKQKGLQGVFISDRQNKKILELIKSLINKSLKRSENLVNIRGIVMDTTSRYDNLIQELILKMTDKIIQENEENEQELLEYISSKLIKNYGKKSQEFIADYSELDNKKFKKLLTNREFNSYMKNRLLNKVLCMDFSLTTELKKIYFEYFSEDEVDGKICFMKHYDKDIISHRNDLAHAHPKITNKGEVMISSKDGKEVIFNGELCSKIRGNLIKYEEILDKFNSALN